MYKSLRTVILETSQWMHEERQYPKKVEDKAKEIADAIIRDKPEMKGDKEKVMKIAWAAAKKHFGLD